MQSFDPIGVGARDLRECLLAQIYDIAQQDEDGMEGRAHVRDG